MPPTIPKFKTRFREEEQFQKLLDIIEANHVVIQTLLQQLPNLRGIDGETGEHGLDGKDGESIKGADGKDGETPSNRKLLELIQPLVPKVQDGKDGTDGKDGKNGTSPTKKEVREQITALLSPQIEEIKKELRETSPKRGGGGGGMGLPVHDQFSGDGSTTAFTLTSNVAAGGLAVFGCRYEGQVQHLGDQYTDTDFHLYPRQRHKD